MSKKLLIVNNQNFHYEIIESIIVKSNEILNISQDIPLIIYLNVFNDNVYKQYISKKYPKIKFQKIEDYDYYINCTIYDKHFKYLNKDKTNVKYISHEITERLKKHPNVYFLTPLSQERFIYADILPFSESKVKSDIPIYIIQGNLNDNRRYLSLLIKILDKTYDYMFLLKIIGKGKYPKELEKYKSKIIVKNNLNFINFHKEFLNAYCILPLISKKTHSQYYNNKLTSTINYARGYNLKCLMDEELQNIYNLENVEVYNNIDDISSAFQKTLKDFYKNNKYIKLSFVKRIKTQPKSIFYSLIKKDNEIIGFGRKHYNKNIIKVVKLNDNFDIIEDNNVDLVGQDPRCFIYKNKLYILNNNYNKMFLIDYETKENIKINIPGKNISFVVHNNTLYFIHYIKPFVLYKFNIEDGTMEKQEVDDDKGKYNYEYRGGTPGYKLDDNSYYGFGHRTYYKNKVLTHDIFKWVIYFENNKLPRISHYNIKQPNNSKNICDPTSVIEVNNKKYLVTAETNQHWFVDQDYITNVYEME